MKKSVENGKSCFNAGLQDVATKKATSNPQVTANNCPSETSSVESRLYAYLQDVEIARPVTSLNLSDFAGCKTAKDYESIVKGIIKSNAQVNEENRKALFNAFRVWYMMQAGTEFETFRVTFWRRFKKTRAFSLTFQSERTNETTNEFEGTYFARPTTYTAFGLRTSYNSCEIARKAPASAQRRADVAKAVNYLLSAGVPQIAIDAMKDAQKLDLAKQMQK